MRFDLTDMSARERYKLLTGTVVPRPIGWISTVDEHGRRNLAPFSYFQIASASPPARPRTASATPWPPAASSRTWRTRR